jgi:pimeloyl-ACP methyl ester carboxylesterase
LFVSPQLVDNRLYFISNLSGRLSLYAMDYGGGIPEPLLPPHIALQNPDLVGGYPFCVFPELGRIVVMVDNDGDEVYQPMTISLDGGFPEPAFAELAGRRIFCTHYDQQSGYIYLVAASAQEARCETLQGRLATPMLVSLTHSTWSRRVDCANADHSKLVLLEGYTLGDSVVYLWTAQTDTLTILHGTPLERRDPGQAVPLSAIHSTHLTPGDRGLVCVTALFDDAYGLGYLDLARPQELMPVDLSGAVHGGVGELTRLRHIRDERYRVEYNIDGVSWLYEGTFDEPRRAMHLDSVVCGRGLLEDGVLAASYFDKGSDRYSLSFSTATSPPQLYTVEGAERRTVLAHTRERLLGLPVAHLSRGEDASFTSHDGLRISARLYMPSDRLGFVGPHPLIYYIHGGPQSQERPNFAWFSLPLIQFLTLYGFAVFVPNVRGSTGYGFGYMKRVDHDWGGQDRLDHVHAMQVLAQDRRLDIARTAVTGRSYGGYMTLTLAARHPELWSAAADLFGPYQLIDFIAHVPETWKPYFKKVVGDPETERDFLISRSPATYVDHIQCPLLVIQGANDPRVVEAESRAVVERLRGVGKEVEYLQFDNEGHDILKYENKVRCYNTMAAFFTRYLHP